MASIAPEGKSFDAVAGQVVPLHQGQPDELLDAALAYAERGWAVFPCQPDGTLDNRGRPSKQPHGRLVPNGKNDATTDPERIRAWWRRVPHANIGVNLEASGLVAADADTYKRDCAWHELVQGREIPATLEQSTPSGGRHYIFKAQPGVNHHNLEPAGLEIIHTGYVLLEPSRVGGKPYRVECDDDPAPAPDWLPRKADKPDDGEPGKGRDNDQLDELLASIGPGNRHTPMLKAINSMIGRGYSDWLIHKVLAPHYGGDDTAEVQRLVRDGRRQWGKVDPGEPGEVTIDGTQPARNDDLPLEWFGTAELVTDHRDFVEGLLTEGGMSVLYGESNSGKTFFASDLAMRVALGWDWQGRETEPGGVLYLACEGGHGIRNREIAFRLEHDVQAHAPFATIRASVNLREADSDTARVVKAVGDMKEATGRDVKLIVVDTLARALAGGEENSSQDMGALVRQVDALRQETGAHVMLIHHSGKDTAKGARGHSSLRAATDTEIEVVRPEGGDVATAIVRKQRDLPGDGEFPFALKSVSLGTDRRGNAITSCIVEPAESPGKGGIRAKLSEEQKVFLDEVRNLTIEHGEHVRPYDDAPPVTAAGRNHLRNHLVAAGFFDPATTPNSQRAAVSKYLNKLKAKGLLGVTDKWVWIVGESATTATTPQPPATGCAGAYRNHRNHPPMGVAVVAPSDADAQEPDPMANAPWRKQRRG